MEYARLVSLLHRLRHAYRTNRHVPLRKEIAALERAICQLYGHKPGHTDRCSICEQSTAVIGSCNSEIRGSNKTIGSRSTAAA